jgi:hypothetical protein
METWIMKISKLFLIALIVGILSSLAVLPVYAQSADIVWAEVDATSVSTDDTVVLTVYVNSDAGRATQPFLPPLDGFEVLRQSSGSQISIINGVRSNNTYFIYELHPLVEGTLTIDTIVVEVDGHPYTTNPVTIEVTQGTGQIQPRPQPQSPLQNFFNMPGFPTIPGFPSLPSILGNPDFPSVQNVEIHPLSPSEAPAELAKYNYYVEAKVDNDNPYQGEQILYTFRFYRAEDLTEQPSYQKPAFTGLWSHPELQKTEYSLETGGKSYRVSELQTILFPTVAGEVTIDPATLTIPDGFFTRGGTLATQPVDIHVKPLPAGAPEGYQGAVGKYAISAAIDTNETMVNETISMQVNVYGQGNIETLSELEWQETPNWRAFDSQSVTEIQFEDGVLSGARLYERTLVPITAGEFTLPAVEFSFFDPDTENYHTTSSDPMVVTVSPDPTSNQTLSQVDTQGTPNLDLPSGVTELRPIKSSAGMQDLSSTLLTQEAGYWLLWLVPLLFLVGQSGWQRRQKSIHANPELQRNKQAGRKARQELHKARKTPVDARNAAGRILNQYLADKLNRSVVGQTHTSLSAFLLEKGINTDLVERVQTCLMLSEIGQYAPQSGQAYSSDLLDETEELISQLEKVL